LQPRPRAKWGRDKDSNLLHFKQLDLTQGVLLALKVPTKKPSFFPSYKNL